MRLAVFATFVIAGLATVLGWNRQLLSQAPPPAADSQPQAQYVTGS